MIDKQRHEYELKFRVGSDRNSITVARDKLQEAGFMLSTRAIETDYLPDAPDNACKMAKMLLRFRHVEKEDSSELVLTLKIRQADNGILHFHEYETDLYSPDQTIITAINDLLSLQVGMGLNSAVIRARTLNEAREAVGTLGFTKQRILLSKYRESFSFGDNNTNVD